MAFSSVFPVIQGVEYGLISNAFKGLEDSVRVVENSYFTAVYQMSLGQKVLDFANKVNEAAGLSLFSWRGKSIIYLTPSLLAVLTKTTIVPEKIRPVLMFFRNHLGTLYQTAAIVSSISLLFFGQTFFASSSLAILGIGVMDQNGWLPVTFRQFLHRYNQPVQIATGLVSGGIFDRIVSLLRVISWIANTNLSRKNAPSESFSFQEKLTIKSVKAYFAGQLRFKINPKYINLQVNGSVYAQIDGADIPFTDKIVYCLQAGRNKWMEELYTERPQSIGLSRTVGKIGDRQDLHNYSFFLNLLGDELGLRKAAAADNDETAIMDPPEKWIFSHILKERVQRKFWEECGPTHLAEVLVDFIGTGAQSISRGDVYNFWSGWIERQEISEEEEKEALREELEEEKEGLREKLEEKKAALRAELEEEKAACRVELQESKLFGKKLVSRKSGLFKEDFMYLMLIDLGIIETETR